MAADNSNKKELAWWEVALIMVGAIVVVSFIVAVLEEHIGLRQFRMK